MRVCPSSAATVFAVIGTLAIFLLPLPCATAPYPVTHGPATHLRFSAALLILTVLTILLLLSLSSEFLASGINPDRGFDFSANFPAKLPAFSLLRC
jgi:hypothetical protein